MTPFCRTRFATPILLILLAACTETGLEPPVVEQIPAPEYAALAVGASHACALDVEGRAFCWGANYFGQLGDGSRTDREAPALVGGGHRFESIDAAPERTCGITKEGALLCWGAGRNLPVPLGPVDAVWDQVIIGYYDVCVIDSAARAFCADWTGALVEVPFGLQWASLSVGGTHVCGVTTSGVGYCWGQNWDRQLGYGGNVQERFEPVPAPGDHLWRELVAGGGFTCGLTTEDATYCWGTGEYMILGTDTIPEEDVWLGVPDPVAIAGGTLAIRELAPAVSYSSRFASRRAACGVADFSGRSTALCWGDNMNLINVGFGRFDWETIELGLDRACGLTRNGRILCWEPVVVDVSPFVRISALLYPELEPTEIPAPARDWRDS